MRPRYAILGPLRVDAVAPSAAKHRALVAALVLAGGDGMSAGRLIDVLWDDDPPATARKALQVYVSELRRARGADVIVTRPSGYAIGPGSSDLAEFDALVARAGGESAWEAADTLRAALALFRGAPLSDAPLHGIVRGRGGTARRRAAERAGAPDRAGPLARARPGARRRARGADRRAPVPRALPRAADARALPLRPSGRGAGGLPPRARLAGRRAGTGSGPRVATPRDGDPHPGPRARSARSQNPPERGAAALAADSPPAASPLPLRAGALLGRDEDLALALSLLRDSRRAVADAHRAGRDRQDAAGARARARARARVSRRRGVRGAGRARRRGAGRSGARHARPRAARRRQLRAGAGRRA